MNGSVVWIAAMSVGCAAACIFISRHLQKKMESLYQNILQRLDRAIGGEIQETAYDESMDAAVTERLNKLIRISGMNQRSEERRVGKECL